MKGAMEVHGQIDIFVTCDSNVTCDMELSRVSVSGIWIWTVV